MRTRLGLTLSIFALLVSTPVAARAGQPQSGSAPPPTVIGGRNDRAAATDKTAAPRPRDPDYVVGPKDVLAITVFNQPALSGKFTVEADGTFTFPLVGRVTAGGMTLPDVEKELGRQLANGFLTRPEISVAVDEYRSQRIFVVGEVRQPGPYPLSGRTTLIEVLALARSTTAEAAKEAIIVRPVDGERAAGPTLPGQTQQSQVITVDLNALQTGDLAKNIVLQDGDTIFVPRAATVVVFGQVRSPGLYPIATGTALVQILAQAGGVTDRGAANRIKIIRTINGTKKELKGKLDDVVRAGDTIVVPERLF